VDLKARHAESVESFALAEKLVDVTGKREFFNSHGHYHGLTKPAPAISLQASSGKYGTS
jgi:hypothetical protein